MTHEEFIKRYFQHTSWYIKNDILYVEDAVALYEASITTLPENLNIMGYLDLYKSMITVLPKNLVVAGDLGLVKTLISSLPTDIFIMGKVHSNKLLLMSEQTQMHIISNHKENIGIIKYPTSKVKTMHKLLWKL